ncbi:hypothetical protein N8I77_000568 [Diaporthe amygdali]|uniref:Uncharacterized protein n=1 Tax=Phomopsis amygdali TaxID=1214568 RepID=A0AAD9SME6_PHOAM|nr:hypothetical protein N8I77_000568 [Diaporthe amygdali]
MTIILVTGANRGIGFAIVQAAAGRIPGATFLLGCRSLEAGKEAAEKLRDLNPNVSFDVALIDIEKDESILAAVKWIDEKYGKLDVLINNAAGVSQPKSQDLGDIRANLNNVFNNAVASPAMVTRAFLPLLRKSDFPRVIMNSSARGSLERTASRKLPPPQSVDYNIAKAGLNMLTLLLQLLDDSKDGEGKNICFWAVSPGFTKTGFNNFRGVKDPLDSAEAFVRLLQVNRGAIPAGTFWEFEEGEFRAVPW